MFLYKLGIIDTSLLVVLQKLPEIIFANDFKFYV